jgi:hypothetical protein
MVDAHKRQSPSIARPGRKVARHRFAARLDETRSAAVRSTAASDPGCGLWPVQPNTIVALSGDQAGRMPSVGPRPARRRRRPVPSALTIDSPVLRARNLAEDDPAVARAPTTPNSRSTDRPGARCRRCSSRTAGDIRACARSWRRRRSAFHRATRRACSSLTVSPAGGRSDIDGRYQSRQKPPPTTTIEPGGCLSQRPPNPPNREPHRQSRGHGDEKETPLQRSANQIFLTTI